MFGHHQQKRQTRRNMREKQSFNQQRMDWERNHPSGESEKTKEQKVSEKSAKSKKEREEAFDYGVEKNRDILTNPKYKIGLDPEKRNAMQAEANKGIHNAQHSASRQLLGDQAARGINSKSGVGYEQRRDLFKIGQEAEQGVKNDLNRLNADEIRRNIAAQFVGGHGEASQSNLDRQKAEDELELRDEKKRQRDFEEQARRLLFTR